MAISEIQGRSWQFPKGVIPAIMTAGFVFLLCLIFLEIHPYAFFRFLFRYFAAGPLSHVNSPALYHRIFFGIERAVFLCFGTLLVLVMRKAGRVDSRFFAVLAIAVVFADLFGFGRPFIRTGALSTPEGIGRLSAALPGTPDKCRVVILGGPWGANDGLRYRFPSVSGYDPLILRRYVYYTQSSQGLKHDDHVVNLGYIRNVDTPLIKMLNVRKIVFGDRVRAVKNEIPYARLVNHTVTMADDQALSFMEGASFDPQRMVVLPPERESQRVCEKTGGAVKGTCAVTRYADEEIRVRISSDRDGYLVLSEIYYPGWRARVDGKPTPILRGNYLFRVVPVKKGEHEVLLYFVSWPFRLGLLISLLTSLCCLWGLRAGPKRRAGGRPLTRR